MAPAAINYRIFEIGGPWPRINNCKSSNGPRYRRGLHVGPDGTADPEVLVWLAEASVKGASEFTKPDCLKALGAALYRAGRFEEAIRRLEEAIRLRDGESLAQGWPFLAMAHHRLGHRDEARRWLDRLRNYKYSTDPNKFWDELEIRLLRRKAESVILYDPIFPADPFAH